MFFAYSALFVRNLLIINWLLVEAAGVEPASEIAEQEIAFGCSAVLRMQTNGAGFEPRYADPESAIRKPAVALYGLVDHRSPNPMILMHAFARVEP